MQEVGNRQTMLITMGNACWVVVAVAVADADAASAAAAAREMQLITYADGSHVGLELHAETLAIEGPAARVNPQPNPPVPSSVIISSLNAQL